jgi:hypothetical protein
MARPAAHDNSLFPPPGRVVFAMRYFRMDNLLRIESL